MKKIVDKRNVTFSQYFVLVTNSSLLTLFAYNLENYESKLLAVNSTHPVILSHNYFQNNYVGEQHTFFESIPSYYRISNADPTGYLTIHAETNTNFATKDYIFVYDGSSSKDKRIAHISSAPVKQTYLSTSKDLWVEVYTNKSFLLNITSGNDFVTHSICKFASSI